MYDVPIALLSIIVGMMIGFSIAKGAMPITHAQITVAQQQCAQAEGLNFLYLNGQFVCNNGLRGTLEELK